MSGNYTHKKYDPNNYIDDIRKSMMPGLYRINPNYSNHNNSCYNNNHNPQGYNQVSINNKNDFIDVDSFMRGLGNDNDNYNDQIDNLPEIKSKPNCCNKLESEYSRFTFPSYEIRGQVPMDYHFNYLPQDPQEHIFNNFSVNTRLQAKDNHITPWQEPLDQSSFYPMQRTNKIQKMVESLNNK